LGAGRSYSARRRLDVGGPPWAFEHTGWMAINESMHQAGKPLVDSWAADGIRELPTAR